MMNGPNGMMEGGMMLGMSLVWLLAVVVLALGAEALINYVFVSNRK